MLALSLRGAQRRSNPDPGAHCPTRLLRGVYPRAAQSADPWARNDSHSIGFDQPDLVSFNEKVTYFWSPLWGNGSERHGSALRSYACDGPPVQGRSPARQDEGSCIGYGAAYAGRRPAPISPTLSTTGGDTGSACGSCATPPGRSPGAPASAASPSRTSTRPRSPMR